MKMKSKVKLAAILLEKHGNALSGKALDDAAIDAYVENMRIAYPRFCFPALVGIGDSIDCDNVSEIIDIYNAWKK